MKLSDIPRQRQSPYAVLVMTSRLIKNLAKQAGVIIVVILLGGKQSGDKGRDAIFITCGLLVLSIIRGLISYFRSYYSVIDNQLIVEKGLLNTSKITIPLDRIQAVDFDQTPIHRIVNLVKVNITTAGSDGNEANIEAITLDKAHALRQVLLSQTSTTTLYLDHQEIDKDTTEIIEHSFFDLVKIGFAENHINSALIIFAFISSIVSQFHDSGLIDKYRTIMPDMNTLMTDLTAIGLIILTIAILSIIISIVKTMLLYFQLRLLRKSNSFRLSHGLLSTRQFTAKDSKIQILGWEQSWLQSLFDFSTLYFKQASTRTVTTKKRLSVPGCREVHLTNVVNKLAYQDQNTTLPWSPISKMYSRYHIRNLIIFLILGWGLCYTISKLSTYGAVLLVFGIYSVISILKRQSKLKYKVDGDHIQIRGGTFGHRYQVVKTYKIQAVSLNTSLYQRRRELANLIISTAAGDVKIPMITTDEAVRMRDEILYYTESSIAPWM